MNIAPYYERIDSDGSRFDLGEAKERLIEPHSEKVLS